MKFVILILTVLVSTTAFGWSGYDYDSSSYIDIESGSLVRKGRTIEIYDYGAGSYRDVEVESISGGEVEVYDSEAGEYRTFDMD